MTIDLDSIKDARSVAVWVCRTCGGNAGYRATSGAPGRFIDPGKTAKYDVICVVPERVHSYDGACECGENRCSSCKGEGMIFVGWGIGWKHCHDCEGSGLVVHRG